MSGKKSRDKGARFERFLVGVLKACFPDTHRGQQSHNPRHCDVEGTPFRIEAKHWASLTYKRLLAAIEQARENGERFEDDRIDALLCELTSKGAASGTGADHDDHAVVIFIIRSGHFFLPKSLLNRNA